MKAYPIWNKIESCIYKSDKSYGVRSHNKVEVLVGTSAKNSHAFLDHEITHKELVDGTRIYRFRIDGQIIKEAILTKDGEFRVTEDKASKL
tara:strand:- start:1251 stop:1523 length:273 start_codon:yes stop_codon:yes gene_type:complete